MNKVVYVSSYLKPIGKNITKKVPTGEKKSGLFGGEKDVMENVTEWEQTGHSDCEMDGERLANDLSKAVEELNKNGYEVVSVTETTSGRYSWKTGAQGNIGGFGYGYGYSITEGLVVVAKKV